jgi:hypothetical protein
VFPDEVIVMLQERKDSATLKGEMTMITRASKLKKVPDAPLDLEDNNPTLVTPVKQMPVLCYVISASDGCMPHFAKSDKEKEKYIEDLDGSYTVDSLNLWMKQLSIIQTRFRLVHWLLPPKHQLFHPEPKLLVIR